MRRKAGLYAVIGGVVGAVLAMAVGHVMPIGAQNGDATFAEITCTRLNVVDAQGNSYVILDTKRRGGVDGGAVGVYGKDGALVQMGPWDEHGGWLKVFGKDGGSAQLRNDEHGGWVEVYGKGGTGSLVGIGVNKHGGGFGVYGKDGGAVQIDVNEHGGRVGVLGKGERGAKMNVDEYGGTVSVYGRGNDYSRAVMGVNEYGNGAVSAWDKNGYRLATLK